MSPVSHNQRPGGEAGGHRVMTFWTAAIERRVLVAVARRLPPRVRPNHLTVLGVAGAIAAGAAYGMSRFHAAWLVLASVGLLVNWLGDSLDGTLARVRKIERPRYGYYLDHIVDAFNTVAVGAGLALSAFVQAELALSLVIVYLALSINVYVETAVYGEFRMAYGRIGPTEARLALVIGNTGILIASAGLPRTELTAVINTIAGTAAAGAVMILALRFAGNLRRLARMEPRRFRTEPRSPAQ